MKAYVDGEKIRGILKERGLTQSALAKKMGLTRQSVSYTIHKGLQRFATLNKLAKILGCDPRDLISMKK